MRATVYRCPHSFFFRVSGVMAIVRTTTRVIGSGDIGTFDTLDAMARIVHAATADPITVGFARQLVVGPTAFASSPQRLQASRIRDWLRVSWRFVDDPVNRELLRTPDVMLQEYDARGFISGDCDEAATLGAALGLSVGIPAAFNVLELNDGGPAGYSHVFASLLPNGGAEITLDVTRPPRGSTLPGIGRWSAVLL